MDKKQIDNILFGIGCNSFNRFEMFLSIAPKLKGELYWYALKESYISSDNLFHFKGLVKASFSSKQPNREKLMNYDEIRYLTSLPEQVNIYRGMTEQELKTKNYGISWTLKKEVAEFFANSYPRNFSTNEMKKVVYEMTIKKNDIVAFFNDRDEFEIIYLNNA